MTLAIMMTIAAIKLEVVMRKAILGVQLRESHAISEQGAIPHNPQKTHWHETIMLLVYEYTTVYICDTTKPWGEKTPFKITRI